MKLLTEYARPIASAMPCRLRNPSPSLISNTAGVAFEVGHDAIRLEGWVRMPDVGFDQSGRCVAARLSVAASRKFRMELVKVV